MAKHFGLEEACLHLGIWQVYKKGVALQLPWREWQAYIRDVILPEAKRAFHELAKISHPDHGGDPEVFNRDLEAYNQVRAAAKQVRLRRADVMYARRMERADRLAPVVEEIRGHLREVKRLLDEHRISIDDYRELRHLVPGQGNMLGKFWFQGG